METWEEFIFTTDANQTFLDQLDDLDEDDLFESIEDALTLAKNAEDSEEIENGLAALTIVAVWCGSTYSYTDFAENHDYIRAHVGHVSDELRELASDVADTYSEHELTAGYEEDFEELTEALG